MPTYPYFCETCKDGFDVTKSVSQIDDDENCKKCGCVAQRHIARVNFNGASDWNSSYNPALGCVVRSKSHQREILSRYKAEGRELIEVGNEPVENIHKHYDQQRLDTQKERWSESPEKILHEALNF